MEELFLDSQNFLRWEDKKQTIHHTNKQKNLKIKKKRKKMLNLVTSEVPQKPLMLLAWYRKF